MAVNFIQRSEFSERNKKERERIDGLKAFLVKYPSPSSAKNRVNQGLDDTSNHTEIVAELKDIFGEFIDAMFLTGK